MYCKIGVIFIFKLMLISHQSNMIKLKIILFSYVFEIDLNPTSQRGDDTLQLKSPINIFRFKVLHPFWLAFLLQINGNLLRDCYHYQ